MIKFCTKKSYLKKSLGLFVKIESKKSPSIRF